MRTERLVQEAREDLGALEQRLKRAAQRQTRLSLYLLEPVGRAQFERAPAVGPLYRREARRGLRVEQRSREKRRSKRKQLPRLRVSSVVRTGALVPLAGVLCACGNVCESGRREGVRAWPPRGDPRRGSRAAKSWPERLPSFKQDGHTFGTFGTRTTALARVFLKGRGNSRGLGASSMSMPQTSPLSRGAIPSEVSSADTVALKSSSSRASSVACVCESAGFSRGARDASSACVLCDLRTQRTRRVCETEFATSR